MIRTFEDLKTILQQCGGHHRIAAVCVYDEATRKALDSIAAMGLATPIYIDATTPEEAAALAVRKVREGEADLLMKGLIGTDQLLHAILHKEHGMLPAGRILTHLSVAEIPTYHKMLFFTDAAVIPYPTQEQRIEQVRYAVEVCHTMGIACPKVALIHCSEKPSKRFPFVDGYQDICAMGRQGDFGACVIDGPLDVKSACSMSALKAKGINSPLQGDADILVMPDIEAGNAFYKSMTLFAGARTAGMLCGATHPIIVPSRGDSPEAKFNSILFALGSLCKKQSDTGL